MVSYRSPDYNCLGVNWCRSVLWGQQKANRGWHTHLQLLFVSLLLSLHSSNVSDHQNRSIYLFSDADAGRCRPDPSANRNLPRMQFNILFCPFWSRLQSADGFIWNRIALVRSQTGKTECAHVYKQCPAIKQMARRVRCHMEHLWTMWSSRSELDASRLVKDDNQQIWGSANYKVKTAKRRSLIWLFDNWIQKYDLTVQAQTTKIQKLFIALH